MKQIVKVMSVEHLTHDVLRIITERPMSISYKPAQAADLSLNRAGWENELRPFTFTSLPTDDHLEFSIKLYPEHEGVTGQLQHLQRGDELIVHDVFGEISYKGEGLFIAGGAGITPFIAILKQLKKDNKVGNNKLLFANKTREDIILEGWFREAFEDNFVNILSKEKKVGYAHGFISSEIIRKLLDKKMNYFYICGPEAMMHTVQRQLHSLAIPTEAIIREAF